MVNEQTLTAYKTAGVDYMFKGPEEHIQLQREKSSQDKNKKRWINQMFRFRTNDSKEYILYILYRQIITTQANSSMNELIWNEDFDDTSIYNVPIVEKAIRFDELEVRTERIEITTSKIKQFLNKW
jgi:hypothetical protein